MSDHIERSRISRDPEARLGLFEHVNIWEQVLANSANHLGDYPSPLYNLFVLFYMFGLSINHFQGWVINVHASYARARINLYAF